MSKREEYLISIFKICETGRDVSNKDLSEWLDLAPATVSEMVKKLKTEGLLKNEKKISLSDEGIKIVKKVLSKHRLWEYFFTEVLDYNWKDVHSNAELFQSVTSDELFNKLNEHLGFPEYCPHGSIIYLNNEEKNSDLVKLSEAEIENKYIIRRIRDNRSLLKYIENIELKIGDRIVIKGYDDFDDSAIISKDGKEIRVSNKATSNIYLKEII
ncbi:metal-dependent transcriptional regulator [Helcococcus kunzii]|uniref:metal-dependent transcriptional regulator n=1 Tax=Helcococcus kunzii TaxID=40091 RepID=UPI0021BBF065|nr:metal-dependent transcriptional regulator [Helcococcus kunzii]